jgi:hypothetical protein
MEAVKYPRRVTRSIVCFQILHVYGIVRRFTSGRRAASRMSIRAVGTMLRTLEDSVVLTKATEEHHSSEVSVSLNHNEFSSLRFATRHYTIHCAVS